MVNVFDYTDYRLYLQAYYDEKKGNNPNFSYQYLALKCGLKNRGFLYNIIRGTKNLSKPHCVNLSRALGHSRKEAEYFENIVFFSQAKTNDARDYFIEQALQCRSGTASISHLLRKDQFEFYSRWYHSAVRSVIDTFCFRDDYEKLGRKLIPPITALQAKKSVKLLERLKLIARREDGTWYITEKSIKAGDEITRSARNRFYLECNELVKKCITDQNPESRDITLLTLGISEGTYRTICNEIRQLKERIITLANNDANAERVYQFQNVFFPLSDSLPLE